MKFNKGDLVYILCQGIWYGSEGIVEGRREDGAYVVAIDYDTPEPKREAFAEEHLRMLNPVRDCYTCKFVNRSVNSEPCRVCKDKNCCTAKDESVAKKAGEALKEIMKKTPQIHGLEEVMENMMEHLEEDAIKESGDSMCTYRKPCIYQKAIERLFDKQFQKGVEKYGVTLEENDTLTTEQRIEHLEEELADGMVYCEHLKAAVGGDNLMADDYQRAALRTAQADVLSPDELLLNGVMGLCGEAGECIDLVKKARFQGHELDRDKLMKELGDVAWYLAVASKAAGFKLSEVFEENVKKLKERYPDGFDKARSIHRNENKTEEKNSETV